MFIASAIDNFVCKSTYFIDALHALCKKQHEIGEKLATYKFLPRTLYRVFNAAITMEIF